MPKSRPEADPIRRQHLANLLKQRRLALGLEQAQIAEQLGVTAAAVGNWERCMSRPDIDTIPQLCALLGVTAAEILGIEPELTLTGTERTVMEAFRQLNPLQQKMIRGLMDQMNWGNIREAQQRIRAMYQCRNEIELGAAAGPGGPLEDTVETTPTYVRVNPLSRRSTCIVRVNGHSMEPKYADGSRVYVDEKAQPQPGDDVVVIYENTMYIKRFEPEGLVSYNPDKKAFPLIKVGGWQDVKLIGKVIGLVNEYDIPSGAELQAIQTAFSPEFD